MATPTSNAPASSTSAPVAPVANPAKAADPKNAASAAPVSTAPVDAHEVTIDGQKVKKSTKELIEAYQLRQLSDKKRAEAEKQMSEYNKLFMVLKQDPIKFMKATGVDFENLATSYLSKKAEDAMADPKDLELRKAKQEAETYKQWVEEQKASQAKQQQEAAVSAERSKIHQEIIQAIEESKELGLPVDEELVIAIAQKMILQDKAKKPLNAKEALPAAYASTQKWLQGMASKMEGEAIVKWLGEDVAKKIRKYDLTQLKAKRAAVSPTAQAAVKPQEKKELKQKPYRLVSEWKDELNKKYPSPDPFSK